MCDNCRELENDNILMNALLESIEMILDGSEVSEFDLSFPIVRRVWELRHDYKQCQNLKTKEEATDDPK